MSHINTELVEATRVSLNGVRSVALEFKGIYIISIIQGQHTQLMKLTALLKKTPLPIPTYVKTEYAAKYFSVDSTFLTKRQGNTFKEGIHFFRPNGAKIIRWSLEALEEWMKAPTQEEENDTDILNKMFE